MIMNKRTKKQNMKGIATIEAALLLSIFVVFMTYCIGTFGIIHTGILNSISSRAYAFETFRNRTNLKYFRDSAGAEFAQTVKYGVRAHGVVDENEDLAQWSVTYRDLAKGRDVASERIRAEIDYENLNDGRKERGRASPVYIKTVYGICLDFECGG